jgi:hypothetical protein
MQSQNLESQKTRECHRLNINNLRILACLFASLPLIKKHLSYAASEFSDYDRCKASADSDEHAVVAGINARLAH